MTVLQIELVDRFVPDPVLLARFVEFVVTFAVIYLGGRFAIEPMVDWLLDVARVEVTFARTIEQVVHVGVLLFGFVAAARSANLGGLFDVTGPLLAAVTLAVGFAARDILANLVGGLFIVADPNFRIGDWIEWGDQSGVIDDITFRVTRVRTFDNEVLTVPNSQLATSAVTNAVERDRLRISLDFWIGYDDDLGEAIRILEEEAERVDEVLADPAPNVRVVEVNDSRVGLQSRLWIADPSRIDFVRVRSTYLERVRDRFHEAGITMPPSW